MGKIIWNHADCTMDLTVQTEKPTGASKNATWKRLDQLSGGEKSYTQVCLLLALWDFTSSPICCTDEFDVFMDACVELFPRDRRKIYPSSPRPNRRIAMQMMVKYLNDRSLSVLMYLLDRGREE